MFKPFSVLHRALSTEIFQRIELLLPYQGSHNAVDLVNLVGDMTESNGCGRIYRQLFVLKNRLDRQIVRQECALGVELLPATSSSLDDQFLHRFCRAQQGLSSMCL